MILIKSKKTKNEDKNMFLSIEIDTSLNQKKENLLEEINNKLSKEVTHYDLKRLEYRKNLIDLTYQLNIDDINKLEKIIKQIELINPNISITYIDQNQVPSI